MVKSFKVAANYCRGCRSFNSLHEYEELEQVYLTYFKQIKGSLSGLRQFLATESPLKMMKNAFYFTSKALSVLGIFKFLS